MEPITTTTRMMPVAILDILTDLPESCFALLLAQ